MNIYVKEITMRLSLYFDTKRLKSANFSRIVITPLIVCNWISSLKWKGLNCNSRT